MVELTIALATKSNDASLWLASTSQTIITSEALSIDLIVNHSKEKSSGKVFHLPRKLDFRHLLRFYGL